MRIVHLRGKKTVAEHPHSPTSTGLVFPGEHLLLNLVRQNSKMNRQPVEHRPLVGVGGEVPDQSAFGGIAAELF